AFVLGMVSGIVAAPCTGPVLTGILLWIGQTRSALLGAAAMFAFSLGLGLPFWLVGTFALSLPKGGKWMVHIKSIFGIVMTVVALYFLKNALPWLSQVARPDAWFGAAAACLIVAGVAIGAVHLTFGEGGLGTQVRKGLGIAASVAGLFMLVGFIQAPRGTLS